MNECTIREATLADCRDVIAIGEIYDGLDWLPDMYEDFIIDPDCFCFVCLVDGEIVGFLAACMVDERTAFVLRYGRVKETRRHRGYYTALRLHIYAVMSKLDTVKYEKVTVCIEIAEKFLQVGSGFDLLAVQVIKRFDFPDDVGSDVTTELQPLNLNDLVEIFSCSKTRSKLFPDGLIGANSLPVTDVEAQDLRKLFGSRTVIYGTNQAGNTLSLLSTGYPARLKQGFRYHLEFFGTNSNDFKIHFLAHLARMRTLSNENIAFTIGTHPDFTDDWLEEIVKLGGVRKPFCTDTLYTFKRKLQFER